MKCVLVWTINFNSSFISLVYPVTVDSIASVNPPNRVPAPLHTITEALCMSTTHWTVLQSCTRTYAVNTGSMYATNRLTATYEQRQICGAV